MLTGKKVILFGAGQVGERAFEPLGPKVYCFADNNKAGQTFCGKPVISFDELLKIHADYDVVLSVGALLREELENQLSSVGIEFTPIDRAVTYEDYPSNPEIAQFKDKHKGRRCFLIGNGPSLRAEDLTTLHEHKEICFGCNAIGKIFDKTLWRPKYYIVIDKGLTLERELLINTMSDYNFFSDWVTSFLITELPSICESTRILTYKSILCPLDEALFSQDPSKAIYTTGTVMYIMIQLVVYMGFSEIYLLGVDGTITTEKDPKKYLSEPRHFYEDDATLVYKRGAIFTRHTPEESEIRVRNAYDMSERYTREHGMRIFNATRGGKLEAFERVNFDLLFR